LLQIVLADLEPTSTVDHEERFRRRRSALFFCFPPIFCQAGRCLP